MPSLRCLSLSLFVALTPILTAQVDRECNTPVDYQHLRHATLLDVQSWSAQGYRLGNFEISATAPTFELNCSMVRNTGPYQASWLFVHDQSRAELLNTCSANNARIVDLERYEVGGVEKLAALLFVNTGAQAKAWHWHTALPQGSVWSTVNGMGNRVIDLEPYLENGAWCFHVISIANSGNDQKPWWVYTNTTPAGVQGYMDQHDARLYEFETMSVLPSTACCVLVQDDVRAKTYWGQYYGSGFDLDTEMGGRVVGLAIYNLAAWCITLVDNLDPFWEYGTGCTGTNGHATHRGLGTAFTGSQVTYQADHLRPWTIAICFYGFQTANVSLAPLGVPGCTAYVNPITSLNYFANASGVAAIPFTVPADPALHNFALVTQVVGLDPGLNALGIQTTNGLITRIRNW
jgi:hypothetical protein